MKKYILILAIIIIPSQVSSFEYDCVFSHIITKEKPYGDIESQGDCVQTLTGDSLTLKKEYIEKLSFVNGLAWIIISHPRPIKVFYVSESLIIQRTHFFDNGPDIFEEGFTRLISNGKFGYMNRTLAIVIPPSYDFAFPFREGLAVVCNECNPEKSGEHNEVLGGLWGVIDTNGKTIIPIIHKRKDMLENEELKVFHKQSNFYY